MPLRSGTKAPNFKLQSTTGKIFELYKDLNQEAAVIYFYPKDFTPGCTKEACSFRDNLNFFKDLNIRIIGISTDSISTHQKFIKEHDLQFELLSDEDGEVSKLYKAYIPFVNLSKRITYLIDKEHKIKAVYQELFGYESHIKAMIKALKQ